MCLSLFSAAPLLGSEGMAKANGIDIWYETFGKKEDPAILLIMGACCQGIMWPTEFCAKLAGKGFYVIRYDHRDAGASTCFDFEKHPYDLLDMTKDAASLLEYLGIEKAHLFGLSTGGPIAELMSVHFPDRVSTISIIATSCDFEPSARAYDGLPPEEGTLPRPTETYLDWMNGFTKAAPQTQEELLEQRLAGWRILNGSKVPFDEELNRDLHTQFLARLRYPQGLINHLNAIKRSLEQIRQIPHQVKVPTLIFHGSEDAIFPLEHGVALAKAINGSHFVPVQGFGHVPNGYFYDMFIKTIQHHIKSHAKNTD